MHLQFSCNWQVRIREFSKKWYATLWCSHPKKSEQDEATRTQTLITGDGRVRFLGVPA